ncbi:hypothetical protein HPB49_001584 [Dermacentor silvarum]|uniref:Uncharacterized protein n=1 Tax=Dermacentor silvarum TaxID=543639 RepID=A0ACB8CJ42_DERSI|nr:hypothetical protein HPB49_001584 [Dermacentor silvarum]
MATPSSTHSPSSQFEIIQWNSRGFGNRRKRSHLLLFLQSRGSLPSVLALQEAGPNPTLSGYCSYIGGTTTSLLVHKSYTAVQVDLDLDLPYDYCMISVLPQKRGAQSIHILNVYCPPHLQRVTFAELFYRALQAAARQPLVVVGDFNAPSPHWGYHYEKARGRKLKELISTLGPHHGLVSFSHHAFPPAPIPAGLPGMGIIRPPHPSIIHPMHLYLHLSPRSRSPPPPPLGGTPQSLPADGDDTS